MSDPLGLNSTRISALHTTRFILSINAADKVLQLQTTVFVSKTKTVTYRCVRLKRSHAGITQLMADHAYQYQIKSN